MPFATIRHMSKDHVTISTVRGFTVTTFTLSEGNVEAVVTADDGSETIRLLVAGPGPHQTMSISTDEHGVVHFEYEPTIPNHEA